MEKKRKHGGEKIISGELEDKFFRTQDSPGTTRQWSSALNVLKKNDILELEFYTQKNYQ